MSDKITEMEIKEFVDCYNERRDLFVKRVQNEGMQVVYPQPNELQIDIDSLEQQRRFDALYEIFGRDIDVVLYEEHVSKSGHPRRHITITLPPEYELTTLERIAYQACLGSDTTRELLSLLRWRRGDVAPTLFVEKTDVKVL